MAYQQNKPQANDKLKNSQADLLGNFQALKTLIDINHETFGSADEGKHKFVTFPPQSSDPGVLGSDFYLYSKTVSGATNMYLQKSNGTPTNLTGYLLSATKGYYMLPSGFLVKFGQLTATGTTTVNFPTDPAIPVFGGQPQHVQITVDAATSGTRVVYWNQGSTTNLVLGVKVLDAAGAAATATFYFFAIGVPA